MIIINRVSGTVYIFLHSKLYPVNENYLFHAEPIPHVAFKPKDEEFNYRQFEYIPVIPLLRVILSNKCSWIFYFFFKKNEHLSILHFFGGGGWRMGLYWFSQLMSSASNYPEFYV